MSTEAETGTRAVAACVTCAAPLGDDQRYCLNCGEPRPGATRAMPAALRSPSPSASSASLVDAPDGAARERPSIGAVLAGVACLLLAMGVGVLLGRGAGESVSQAPVPVAAAGATTAAAPSTASFASDWPAETEGWTVALSLLPAETTTPDAVAAAKAAATAKGAASVGVLDSSAYPSLTAGSFVVYSGVFDTEAAATSARIKLAAGFPDARVVRVAAAAAAAAAAAPGGSTRGSAPSKPASGSAATKKSAGDAADTTQEFEKSKKAPKTVGTGGKPLAKDNKPAAGGGEFEDIG